MPPIDAPDSSEKLLPEGWSSKNFIQRVMQPPTHVGVILTISGSHFEVTLEISTRFLGEIDLVSGSK